MDTQINIVKAIHEGAYEGMRGKKLKMTKRQKTLLTSNKRAYLTPRGSGAAI